MNTTTTNQNGRNTLHSIDRAKEHAGLSRRRAEKMMELARERGIGYEECRWSVDRSYLSNRTNDTAKAVAYNGYCFIFDRQSLNCITMYPLPKSFGKKKTFYRKDDSRDLFGRELKYA